MGRYITGDLDYKFWFGVQSSDDADFFGVTGQQPEELEYYFSIEDLPKVKEGIEKCKEALGKNKAKLDKFFKKHNGYNDEMMVEAGFPEKDIPEILKWYARLELGKKIYDYTKKHKSCCFEAEL